MSLVIAQELLLDAKPCAARRVTMFTNIVMEADGDHAKQIGKHITIHLMPS